MYDRNVLRTELIRDEDLVLTPYQDSVGVWTVGVGHNLQAKPITHDTAMVMLEHDIRDSEESLDRISETWRTLDGVRQRVLLNMVFNLGEDGLRGFRNMWSAVDAADYEQAAHEMLDSRWAVQVGVRATRLADMMRTGMEPA